jgi:hypothetical protein
MANALNCDRQGGGDGFRPRATVRSVWTWVASPLYPPIASELLQRSKLTRCAMNGLMHRSKQHPMDAAKQRCSSLKNHPPWQR